MLQGNNIIYALEDGLDNSFCLSLKNQCTKFFKSSLFLEHVSIFRYGDICKLELDFGGFS